MRQIPRWLWLALVVLAVAAVLALRATRPSPLPPPVCEAQVGELDTWMKHAVSEANPEFMPGDGAKLVGQTFDWEDEFWGRLPRPAFAVVAGESRWYSPWGGEYFRLSQRESLCEWLRDESGTSRRRTRSSEERLDLLIAVEWNTPWSQVLDAVNCTTSFETVRFAFKGRPFTGSPARSPLDPSVWEHWIHSDRTKTTETERTRALFQRALNGCESSSLVDQAGRLAEAKGAERASLFMSALEEDLRRCSCAAHFDELRSLAWYFIGPFFRRDTLLWTTPARVHRSDEADVVRIAFPPNAQLHSIAEALVNRTRDAKGHDVLFAIEPFK